ncbi:MAG TPA: hypothetical protein PKA37_12370 [Planctomycetota bacterium]|nr:hypothetical protein [Planctomycetota bacterium]
MVQTEGTREVSRSIDNDSLFPARLVDSDLDLANIPTLGHSPDAVLDLAFGSGMRFMDGYALVARSTEFRDFAIQSMTKYRGRQRVPAESLAHFVVVVAPKPVVERFGRLIKPLLARAGAGSTESRSRAALRDRLLPHLISGALRVKDAERVIKAATV